LVGEHGQPQILQADVGQTPDEASRDRLAGVRAAPDVGANVVNPNEVNAERVAIVALLLGLGGVVTRGGVDQRGANLVGGHEGDVTAARLTPSPLHPQSPASS
jgi:hypothetical protein